MENKYENINMKEKQIKFITLVIAKILLIKIAERSI